MIRQLAAIPSLRFALRATLLMVLAGTPTLHAQQTSTPAAPPQQQPDNQQPSGQQSGSQETAQQEEIPQRRAKPKDYKNWSFNIGGGGSLTNGTTTKFARGGGGVAAAGVARNYSKYFG